MKRTVDVESLEDDGGGVIFGWELRLKCWRSDDWSGLAFFNGGFVCITVVFSMIISLGDLLVAVNLPKQIYSLEFFFIIYSYLLSSVSISSSRIRLVLTTNWLNFICVPLNSDQNFVQIDGGFSCERSLNIKLNSPITGQWSLDSMSIRSWQSTRCAFDRIPSHNI
jgi:hypothetical protein